MTLYSRNGSNPAPIPFRIRLSSGNTRTDPSTFTEAEIADAGYVEAPEQPVYDPETQPAPKWTGTEWVSEPSYDPATQHEPRWTGDAWAMDDKTADELEAEEAERAEATRSAIDAERQRRVLAGTTVTLTDGTVIPLQGRPEDQINMLALKDTARDLQAAGVTDPILPFRDGSNTMHMLTPAQMVEATDAGKTHVGAVYQAAWALVEMDPVPADYADDAYWP